MRLFPLTTGPDRTARGGERGAMDFDAGNERLRDAHLHNGQVEARALFAPFFAITAVAAALITGWAMYGSVETRSWSSAGSPWSPSPIGCRAAARWSRPRRGGSRTARPRARWFAVVEAVGLAGLWSALPT